MMNLNWSVMNISVMDIDWKSRSLGAFNSGMVIANGGNVGLDHWSRFVMMMLMVMMVMVIMMPAMVVIVLMVLVKEVKVTAGSNTTLVGEESVGEAHEVRSVVGFSNEHVLDKVVGEIRITAAHKLKSFLDQALVNGTMLVVIEVFRVEESSQREEGGTQRVDISLRFVTLDLEVVVGNLLEPFRGQKGLDVLDDLESESIGALLSVKGRIRELVGSVLAEDVEWSDISVGVTLGLEIRETTDQAVSNGEELVFSVIDLSGFTAFEVSLEIVVKDLNID
jgi:hypothetical protein